MAAAVPLLVMAMLIVVSIGGRRAHGAAPMTFTVTNLNDSGEGSLSDAIAQANANLGADTITFEPGVTGTILLASQLPAITDDLDITGPGATSLTVSGNNARPVFLIGHDVTVLISRLTISNGNAGIGFLGCGIQNSGTLTITNCTVSHNGSGSGGGIFNGDGATLTITNSTVSDNTAFVGGGVRNGGTLTIINSTVSGNSAGDDGGGGIHNSGTLMIINSTLSGNSAPVGGVGGILNTGTVNIKNSIVANSQSGDDCAGSFLTFATTSTPMVPVASPRPTNSTSARCKTTAARPPPTHLDSAAGPLMPPPTAALIYPIRRSSPPTSASGAAD